VASEEVIVQLLKSKYLPVLYYGLDACSLNRDQVRSLEFAVNSCFRKIENLYFTIVDYLC